jgi:hypothetical protein
VAQALRKETAQRAATNAVDYNIFEVILVRFLGPGGLVPSVYTIFKNAKIEKSPLQSNFQSLRR